LIGEHTGKAPSSANKPSLSPRPPVVLSNHFYSVNEDPSLKHLSVIVTGITWTAATMRRCIVTVSKRYSISSSLDWRLALNDYDLNN
jgi:hypothetical protein